MKIAELFRRDIDRTIEEVVKVDVADQRIIINELDEYVATDHLLEEFEEVCNAFQDSILSPNETTNIWVSGFFGSGKSAFAKTLGYLLWNPMLDGRSAADRFFERNPAPRLSALLNTIHSRSTITTVLLNLATGSNVVAREGESVVLPVYRALLARLGYSQNFVLAELEHDLEGDKRLEDFRTAFAEATGGKVWEDQRYTILAKNQASHALHLLDSSTFSSADSWAKAVPEPAIDSDWFATRALELLERRAQGTDRLVFVVDEVGQYVSRTVQRMLDLQGLAESFQKLRGQLWLVVTSQEKLNDVVDSLESRQIELARVQARFPLRPDLLPSDIQEVAGKRVLDKTDAGQHAVREAVGAHRNRFLNSTRLASPTRSGEPSEDEIVRLYPLVPYQVQLLIDAVSARRNQGVVSDTTGGSNRTIIKHAQQLVAHRTHGLGDEQVGALVTLDRSYELLEETIPTAWRGEIEQVGEKYGDHALETRVMKAIALCSDVHALELNVANIAVLLHPSIGAESIRGDVAEALDRLFSDDRLREADGGFRLQSPEQKAWEQARRGIDLAPGESVRLRRLLLRQAFSGLSVNRGRTFRAELRVEGEKLLDGDLGLEIEEADAERRDELRALSRETAAANRITWVYEIEPDTRDALRELHRSRTIIERRDRPPLAPAELALVGEERQRRQRHEATATARLGRDLVRGQTLFRGEIEQLSGTDLRTVAQSLLAERLSDIYPRLDEFTASLRPADVLAVLRADDLSGLPDALGEDGIGLLRTSSSGTEIVTDSGPLSALLSEVKTRTGYGHDVTGAYLEQHFGAPPYGASVELVEALCAAGVRAGAVEVRHQGQRIANASDARLDQVFRTLPRFRSTSFRPPSKDTVSLEIRTDVAEKYEHLTGARLPGLATETIADALRGAFGDEHEACVRVQSALDGAGLTVPDGVGRTQTIIDQLRDDDDVAVVTSAHATWADLASGRELVGRLADVVATSLDDLRSADREARRSEALSEDLEAERTELEDLLAAGDYHEHLGRIKGITTRLRQARTARAAEVAARVRATLVSLREQVEREFGDLNEVVVQQALRRLDELHPPEAADGLAVSELEARLDAAETRADAVRRQLEDVRSAGRLVRIRVEDIVSSPITNDDELEGALGRIREAVAAELADDRQVKLQ